MPARDLNGRENDQAPAKIMLDIEIISPPLCETNTIDADSIEVVAYDPDTGWFSSAWWPIVPEGYPEWHYDLSLVSLDANTWAIRATSLNSVPEPATMFLLAVGAVALRSRRRQS